jgi:uncharacterized protein involved in oxidation of intracellular sulfur
MLVQSRLRPSRRNRSALRSGGHMKFLIILNDAPYGIERTYNGLRIAGMLAKRDGVELKIFLMGDAVISAVTGQTVPAGYYNTQVMLSGPVKRGATVGVCGTCMSARGVQEAQLIEGTHRSNMEELTDWILWADKVIAY